MSYAELVTILRATGYPVAFSHFIGGMPTRPCIAYVDSYSSNFQADNKVHHKIPNIQIELYTDKKDLTAESALENVLDQNEIPYDSIGPVWLSTEGVYQKLYEVRLL